ncbi:MAG TPA: deoxyribodipyrimidine photo-lyase, partial [Candidatus Brocadiia bacterium]|nr:deoxyribodipyrimidine photo-lyase [Candidatus Brocadiia bacterium]
MIQPERIRILNARPRRRGAYTLYWMQQAQRAEWNHALEFAAEEANRLRQPLVACFGLTDAFPEANLRHLAFMIEGLAGTARALRRRGVALVIELGSPETAAIRLAEQASLVVADRGYLRCQRQWRERLARAAPCQVIQVETDVVVPIEAVSGKEEYAAATLRPRLRKVLDRFLVPLAETPLVKDSLGLRLGGEQADKLPALLDTMRVDRSVAPSARFHGGADEARRWLARFIEEKLDAYADQH